MANWRYNRASKEMIKLRMQVKSVSSLHKYGKFDSS